MTLKMMKREQSMQILLLWIIRMKLVHQASQVPIISSIKMSNVEYKMLVEKLTSEMFNVHTSTTTDNEEIQKLSSSNSKLIE